MYAMIANTFKLLEPRIWDKLCETSEQGKCVVLDIDGTVLIVDDNNEVVPVMEGLAVVDMCHKLNVPVYYLTARVGLPNVRDITIQQLNYVGVHDIKKLICFPPGVTRTQSNVAAFKAGIRNNLPVGLNVGNAWSDVMQHTEKETELVVGGNYYMFQGSRGEFHVKLPFD